MKTKIAVILIFCIVFSTSSIFAYPLELSEIMYYPEDSEEWIEFNTLNSSIDLFETEITDNFQTDKILCCQGNLECNMTIPENTFFRITDSEPNLTRIENHTYCADDTRIGNGLGNENDFIRLTKGNDTIAGMEYNYTLSKGHTLSLINGSYLESFPTPLFSNTAFIQGNEQNHSQDNNENETSDAINSIPDISLEIVAQEKIFTDTQYTSFFKVRNLDYPKYDEEINLIVFYNVTFAEDRMVQSVSYSNFSFLSSKSSQTSNITFYRQGGFTICAHAYFENDTHQENNAACADINVSDANSVPCNIILSSSSDKEIYDSGEKVSLNHKLNDEAFPYEIEYWAEDLFGNIEFQKTITKNTNTKHIGFDPDETDRAYLIFSRLIAQCNNSADDSPSRLLVVSKGENLNRGNESSITIISVSSAGPKFGDTIVVRLSVHKGETRKTSVKIYAQGDGKKISEEASLNINNKNTDYEFSISLKLKDNCDKSYSEEKYSVLAEGLDTISETEIELENNDDCPVKTIKQPEAKTASGETHQTEQQEISGPIGKLYELASVSQENSTLFIRLIINNPDSKIHNYSISASVYSGRDAIMKKNATTEQLEGMSDKITSYSLDLEGFASGNYTLRLKILRDDRKTPYEISEDFAFEGPQPAQGPMPDEGSDKKMLNLTDENKTINLEGPGNSTEKKNTAEISGATGNIIYNSKNSVLKDKSVYFVVLVLILFSIVILLRKNN